MALFISRNEHDDEPDPGRHAAADEAAEPHERRAGARNAHPPGGGSPADAKRSFLLAGAAASPLFITAAAAQVATRDGFDLGRHALPP